MNESDKYFNIQNFNLLYHLNQFRNLDAIIEIHEKRPVHLFIDEPYSSVNPEHNKEIWQRLIAKNQYRSLLKKIQEISFGKIILKIRDFKIIEMKSYFKLRLQLKK